MASQNKDVVSFGVHDDSAKRKGEPACVVVNLQTGRAEYDSEEGVRSPAQEVVDQHVKARSDRSSEYPGEFEHAAPKPKPTEDALAHHRAKRSLVSAPKYADRAQKVRHE